MIWFILGFFIGGNIKYRLVIKDDRANENKENNNV